MARVLSYTPEWLSRPSPGFDFLSEAHQQKAHYAEHTTTKRLACIEGTNGEGTQIFFATGNELRWGDIHLLEEAYKSGPQVATSRGWRVLKTPVARPIQQISVSPDGQLLAVVTTHTCHVCILPPRSHLASDDTSALRLKAFQVGPTAHVLEQSPLVSILWHPLSVRGLQSLVTVTKDACVRLWELDLNDRYSFDQAQVAYDLKKLANATSITSNVTTSRFGVNRTFSPDEAEMAVAAACFGGSGGYEEHSWASMTLWIAMAEGDVYAICPLLPSRFALPTNALPSLSTQVIAAAQLNASEIDVSASDLRKSNDHKAWVADLDSQDPLPASNDYYEVFVRPSRPGPVPKLQGPFQLSSDQTSLNIAGIHVIAPSVNQSYLFDEVDDSIYDVEGASIGIVCLATTNGQVLVSVLLEDVTPEWLPQKQSRAIGLDDEDVVGELLVLHKAELSTGGSAGSSAFTASPVDRHEVLVTSSAGVQALDFKPWLFALEDELSGNGPSGADFRLQMLLESASTTVKTIISAGNASSFVSPTAALAIAEPGSDLIVLSTTSTGPHAAVLEVATNAAHPFEPELLTLPAPEPRESYQPPPVFFQTSELSRTMSAKHSNPAMKVELAKQVRAKPETLQLLTETHRVLSQETHRLGLAAADLFRRCDRMRIELQDQVSKVHEISEKAQATIEGTSERIEGTSEEDTSIDAAISGRILRIQSNSKAMEDRIKQLRSDILRLGSEELSIKERSYLDEVQHLKKLIGSNTDISSVEAPVDPGSIVHLPDHENENETSQNADDIDSSSFSSRLQAAELVKQGLIEAIDNTVDKQTAQESPAIRAGSEGENEYKKKKLGRVLEMLERETALIDAVTARLAHLGVQRS